MISKKIEEMLISKANEISKKENMEFLEVNYGSRNVDNINTFVLIFRKEIITKLLSSNPDDDYINVVRIVSI